MKKEGFNPRINTDGPKSRFKMNIEELDEEKQIMENELKRKRIVIRGDNINNNNYNSDKNMESKTTVTKNSIPNSDRSQINNITKVKKIQIGEKSSKMKIISNYKISMDSKIRGKVNSDGTGVLHSGSGRNSPTSTSFISHKKKISPQNKTDDAINSNDTSTTMILQPTERLSKLNISNTSKSQTKTRNFISNFKNNLKKEENSILSHRPNTPLLNTSNLEIFTSKTQKTLVPLSPDRTNDDTGIKNMVKKMKLCHKHHLPNKKNYFVSEKNVKLIESAISEKDQDINNLRNLLSLAKNDFNNFQNKYSELYSLLEEVTLEKNKILDDFEEMLMYNKQLHENFDEYIYQYNRILVYFKKIESIVNFALNIRDSYREVLKDDQNRNESSSVFEISKNSKFWEILKMIDLNISESEKDLKAFNDLFINCKLDIEEYDQEKEKENSMNKNYKSKIELQSLKNKLFLLSPLDNDYLKIEKQNKIYKQKIYDYENYINKITYLYETKNIDLSDVARDMISTKKRITELDFQVEDMEKENEYLRVSYHNLYNDYSSLKSNQDHITSSLTLEIKNYKITEENLKQSNLEMIEQIKESFDKNNKFNEEIKILRLELKKSLEKKAELDKLEADKFQLILNEYDTKIANLNQDLAEKERIIVELKSRLMDCQKDKSIQKVSIKSKKEEIMNNAHSEDSFNFNNYLNKSDDNIIFASEDTHRINTKNLERKLARYEVEIKVLKNKLKDFENLGSEINITKSKKNINTSSTLKISDKDLAADLLFHLYNQSQLIEKLNLDIV